MTNREAAIEWFSMLKEKFAKTEYGGYLDMAISALEMQEQAENEWCPDCAEYDKENHCCHRFTKVIRQTVEECKREWANEGWIPVTERLPEVGQSVMISVAGVYTAEGCLKEDGNWCQFRWSAEHDRAVVDAWKPLPEAYQEEEE